MPARHRRWKAVRGTRIRWPADRRKSPDPGLDRNMDAGAGVPAQGHGPAQGDGRGGQGRAGPHGRASEEGAGLPDAGRGVPAGAASLREPPASGSSPTRRGPSPARLPACLAPPGGRCYAPIRRDRAVPVRNRGVGGRGKRNAGPFPPLGPVPRSGKGPALRFGVAPGSRLVGSNGNFRSTPSVQAGSVSRLSKNLNYTHLSKIVSQFGIVAITKRGDPQAAPCGWCLMPVSSWCSPAWSGSRGC